MINWKMMYRIAATSLMVWSGAVQGYPFDSLTDYGNLIVQSDHGSIEEAGRIGTVQDTIEIIVKSGWNILSLPLHPDTNSLDALFPNAKSKAFRYRNGYFSEDTLTHGNGYWMKFDSAETLIIVGTPCISGCSNVNNGWNLVGASAETRQDSLFFIEPRGRLLSPFYGYDPDSGYQNQSSLKPGRGYWVKSDGDGSLVYDNNGTNWVATSNLTANVFSLDTAHPNILYAGTFSDFSGGTFGKLFKSTNRGQDWDTLLHNLDFGGIHPHPIDSSIVYVTVGTANCQYPGLPPGIIKSTDGGKSWFYADSGIYKACDTGPGILLIDWSNPGVLYGSNAGFLGGDIYLSEDAGNSWHIPFYRDTLNCDTDPRCALGGPVLLLPNMVDPDIVYAQTIIYSTNFLLKGSNRGSTWSYLAEVPFGPYAAIVPDPHHPTGFYSGGPGLFYSTDEGSSWTDIGEGLPESIYVGAVHVHRDSPVRFVLGKVASPYEAYLNWEGEGDWTKLPFPYGSISRLVVDWHHSILYVQSGLHLYRKRLKW